MKTHSRVQYTTTIGDRVRTSAQARTIVKWLVTDYINSERTVRRYDLDVRNIHTGQVTTVELNAYSYDPSGTLWTSQLLDAKAAVGA